VDEIPEREPQRVLGMRIEPGHSWPLVNPTEQRVFGVPRSWFAHEPVDLSGLRHPVRWVRWRTSRDRRGASVPDFKEFLAGPQDER
jgi:hypothetical protein